MSPFLFYILVRLSQGIGSSSDINAEKEKPVSDNHLELLYFV